MKKSRLLSNAISLALGAGVLALAPISDASASTTMYNKWNGSLTPRISDGPTDGTTSGQTFGTDGWVWGANGAVSGGDSSLADPGWVGTGASYTPFDYVGSRALNWAAHLTNTTDHLTVSQADSFNRFGIYADIDTAGGAWRDLALSPNTGWRHNIDIGLFKSDVGQTIKLTIAGVLDTNDNFGISIYKGMSTETTVDYAHHGDYYNDAQYFGNDGNNATDQLEIYARTALDANGLTSNSLSFYAEAGQIYTIVLGGNIRGNWQSKYDSYALNIAPAAVPLPGSVWLFASGLMGLLAKRKRSK